MHGLTKRRTLRACAIAGGGMGERWWLDNAEEAHAAAPRSFFIPPEDKRRNLKLGDEVKLLFRFDPPVQGYSVERMWVEVSHVETDQYRGLLRNEPDYMSSLTWGDEIVFGPEHVAAYMWDPDELGYEAAANAWTRRDFLERAEHPGRASMRPPSLRADDGDSGWLLWKGDELLDDVTNPEYFDWVSLGWLTDLFPALEPVFRAGEGDWSWDSDEREYALTRSDAGPAWLDLMQ
jgi:hypothetical protein